MKRRGLLNLFAAASVAVACRLQPEPGFRHLRQRQLKETIAMLTSETKTAWNARYRAIYDNLSI